MRKLTDLGLTYEEAAHGVQTAIKHEMQLAEMGRGDPANADRHPGTEPKHLRVGIDLRACDHAALASLMIEKGLITEAEYVERIRVFVNDELAGYERKHSPLKFR